MCHLFKMYTICKFTYFRLWYLKSSKSFEAFMGTLLGEVLLTRKLSLLRASLEDMNFLTESKFFLSRAAPIVAGLHLADPCSPLP